MADLLVLALRACADHEAQPVLGDAVLEAGWFDSRVMSLVVGEWGGSALFYGDRQDMTTVRNRNRFMARAGRPDRRWCRAVAAVLLLDGWSAEMWPGVETSRRPAPRLEDMMHQLRSMWGNAGISEMLYEPSPFFGLVRKEDPQRLAGQRIETSGDVRERIIEAARRIHTQAFREPPELAMMDQAIAIDIERQAEESQPGALVALWDQEIAAASRRARRIVDGLPAPGNLRYGRRR